MSVIEQSHQTCFDNEEAWKYYLQNNSIITQRHVRIATEGALLGH
ncbi:hypothetical protein [sulfur-oxidizing endosymbiont of Gigantopelta aegis]|nr:hypothetical protein [sulfur-oxidizing endosymbiont of Gigantopelta aegis]